KQTESYLHMAIMAQLPTNLSLNRLITSYFWMEWVEISYHLFIFQI
ncbi:hypothetical protein BpHYR1_022735, partial [Brachionus plicatilis]